MGQDGAKTAQDSAKTDEAGAKTAQDSAKTLQDGAETVQDAPKTFPKRDFRNLETILGRFWEAKARPRRSKMAGERSARASEASEARGAPACSAKQTEEMR